MMIYKYVIYFSVFVFLSSCSVKDEEKRAVDVAASLRGEDKALACEACHSLNSEENKVGPHLVAIVGREVASVSGYGYSDALLEKKFYWSEEQLIPFILAPTKYVPGTKMAFSGIDENDAKDIYEYLLSLD